MLARRRLAPIVALLALASSLAPAPAADYKPGQVVTLGGGGAYLFRDPEKAEDYAILVKADPGAGSKYLNTLSDAIENFRTADGRPAKPSDVVLLHGGSKVVFIRPRAQGVIRVQVREAIVDLVNDSGRTHQGRSTNYVDEVAYIIPGLIPGP